MAKILFINKFKFINTKLFGMSGRSLILAYPKPLNKYISPVIPNI